MPLLAVHRALDALFEDFREAALVGDGGRARARLAAYRALTADHADAEEHLLLSVTPDARRWPDELYLGQHVKLLAGLQRVEPLLVELSTARAGWQRTALAVLDAAATVRHLAEHHHLAEEQDLFVVVARQAPELLDEIAARFWAHPDAPRRT